MSIDIDSISLIPDAYFITNLSGELQEKTCWEIYPISAKAKKIDSCTENFILYYQTYGYKILGSYQLRDTSIISTAIDPFAAGPIINPNPKKNKLNLFPGIESSGSISRGVRAGNSQSVSLQARMNLQLEGKINENTEIRASIHDENIPAQSEGYTQQLQEFDKVNIALINPNFRVEAGDLDWQRMDARTARFDKKTSGILLNVGNEESPFKVEAGAGLSRGSYALHQFVGVEGNQGPYRLQGNNNELFIIIISGSERVFVDGKRLTRGENFDYVIDYNAAEIRFTSNFLITKDSRISVEFQYAQRNYARFLAGGALSYHYDQGFTSIEIITETEAKNQQLQQELESDDIIALSQSAGNLAFVQEVQPSKDIENRILYQQIDSLGFDTVWLQSIDTNLNLFIVNFSYLGPNQGNYRRASSSLNGIVYEWVAPVNGVPQGEYEPLRKLVAPVSRQQLLIRNKHNFTDKLSSYMEFARTTNDVNQFSRLDADAPSNALLLNLGSTADGFSWAAEYQIQEDGFLPFEDRYDVEFNRDWSLGDSLLTRRIQQGTVNLNFERDSLNKVLLQSDYLEVAGKSGLRQKLGLFTELGKLPFMYVGSYRASSFNLKSNFYKHQTGIRFPFGEDIKQELQFESWYEDKNEYAQTRDSLNPNSFAFAEYRFNYTIGFKPKGKILLALKHRTDDKTTNGTKSRYTEAQDYSLTFRQKWENDELSFKGTSRNLNYIDSNLRENTVLASLSYQTSRLDDQLSIQTQLETGSGREPRRVFSYLQVNPGQGQYSWIDYNDNGQKELDEFVVPALLDTATYIRVFSPTTEFQSVSLASGLISIGISPRQTEDEQFWRRFSNQVSLRVNNRVLQENGNWEAVWFSPDSARLVGAQTNLYNQLAFDKFEEWFSAYYTYSYSQNRQLLAYGLESQETISNELMLRNKLSDAWSSEFTSSISNQQNRAGAFESRNYELEVFKNQLILRYLKGLGTEFSFEAAQRNGSNLRSDQQLKSTKLGLGFTYRSESLGNIRSDVAFFKNDFEGAQNNQASFELLQGLDPGENYTWGLNWDRGLTSGLRVNIQYQGRKSADRVVHTGSMELKLLF